MVGDNLSVQAAGGGSILEEVGGGGVEVAICSKHLIGAMARLVTAAGPVQSCLYSIVTTPVGSKHFQPSAPSVCLSARDVLQGRQMGWRYMAGLDLAAL